MTLTAYCELYPEIVMTYPSRAQLEDFDLSQEEIGIPSSLEEMTIDFYLHDRCLLADFGQIETYLTSLDENDYEISYANNGQWAEQRVQEHEKFFFIHLNEY